MDAGELVRGYLVLGLRLGRLVSGFVDSFTGDPALSRAVDNEPRLDPRALAVHARELRKELPGSDLAEQRKQFLDAHLRALECTARKLAGERITFVDEVEQYFQVRIRPGDEDAYAQAHRNLDVLLPGRGIARRPARRLPRGRRGAHTAAPGRAYRPCRALCGTACGASTRCPSRRSWSTRSSRTSRGAASTTTSAATAAGSRSTPTSATACRTCRISSRTSPIRAITPSTAARRRASSSSADTPSSRSS